jgi:hypothetical protein
MIKENNMSKENKSYSCPVLDEPYIQDWTLEIERWNEDYYGDGPNPNILRGYIVRSPRCCDVASYNSLECAENAIKQRLTDSLTKEIEFYSSRLKRLKSAKEALDKNGINAFLVGENYDKV